MGPYTYTKINLTNFFHVLDIRFGKLAHFFTNFIETGILIVLSTNVISAKKKHSYKLQDLISIQTTELPIGHHANHYTTEAGSSTKYE